MKGVLAWMLTAPLALVSSQLAHDAAYLGAEPDDDKRSHLLESTGHGYLAEVGKADGADRHGRVPASPSRRALRLRAARRPDRAPRRRLRSRSFPSRRSCFQEHLERLLHDGQLPVRAAARVADPARPRAPAAVRAAGLRDSPGCCCARPTRSPARSPAAGAGVAVRGAGSARVPLDVSLPRTRVRARGYTGRGPPLSA